MLLNNRCTYSADKFGFYQAGDIKTYSKIEAIEAQKRTGHFPEWNFNRSVFDRVNWKVEPPGQLWDYYKARARQIRESYDYCVLFYSGGSDSHNLLSAWIDEGCYIDEIASYCYFDAGGRDAFMNDEVDRVAIPLVNELAKTQAINYRLIDFSQDVAESVKELDDDWAYLSNFHWTPNAKAIIKWRQRIKEYQDLISAGKRVCFVWGSDKPKIFWDGKLYFQFVDIIDNCISPYTQNNYQNGYYDELFYWTPDMPELLVKQSHVIKQFVETVHDAKFYDVSGRKDTHGAAYNKIIKGYLTPHALKQVIYPKWDPATYVAGKSSSRVWSVRDEWFVHGNLQASQQFRDFSRSFFSSLDPYWLSDPLDYLKGVKGSVSPKYYLE
jgi:hypothetical protein